MVARWTIAGKQSLLTARYRRLTYSITWPNALLIDLENYTNFVEMPVMIPNPT